MSLFPWPEIIWEAYFPSPKSGNMAPQMSVPPSRRKRQFEKCSVAVKTLELLGYFNSLWEQRGNAVKVRTSLEKPGHMAVIPNQPANYVKSSVISEKLMNQTPNTWSNIFMFSKTFQLSLFKGKLSLNSPLPSPTAPISLALDSLAFLPYSCQDTKSRPHFVRRPKATLPRVE